MMERIGLGHMVHSLWPVSEGMKEVHGLILTSILIGRVRCVILSKNRIVVILILALD